MVAKVGARLADSPLEEEEELLRRAENFRYEGQKELTVLYLQKKKRLKKKTARRDSTRGRIAKLGNNSIVVTLPDANRKRYGAGFHTSRLKPGEQMGLMEQNQRFAQVSTFTAACS